MRDSQDTIKVSEFGQFKRCLTFTLVICYPLHMKSVYRGLLAVIGAVAGFFTLVFLSQTIRYLQPALIGDELSLGMFGVYLLLSFGGCAATILSFRPQFSTVKYISGVGLGIGGLLFISAVFSFASNISAGLMLLIFAGVQVTVAGGMYGASRLLGSGNGTNSESVPESD